MFITTLIEIICGCGHNSAIYSECASVLFRVIWHIVNLLTVCSDEDTSVEAVVMRWLQNQDEDYRDALGGWIKDYFYDALKWTLEQVYYLQLLRMLITRM